MPKEPVLSVVTVTLNDREGLARTLASIAEQSVSRERFELIVVDGGSTDGTAELLAEGSDLLDSVISEPDRGPYDAMNKGWRAASGEFVQFLNAGDTYESRTSMATILEHLAGAGPASWFIGGATHLHGGVKESSVVAFVPHSPLQHALGRQPHVHQACVFSMAQLHTMGGYALEADILADFDLILRCGLASLPLQTSQPVVRYEGGGMSATRTLEIPGLMHTIRVRRLGLSGGWTALSASWTRFVEIRASLQLGTRLRRAKSRRGSSRT